MSTMTPDAEDFNERCESVFSGQRCTIMSHFAHSRHRGGPYSWLDEHADNPIVQETPNDVTLHMPSLRTGGGGGGMSYARTFGGGGAGGGNGGFIGDMVPVTSSAPEIEQDREPNRADEERARENQNFPASEHPHHGIHWRQDATNELLAFILRELREMRKDMSSGFDNLSNAVSGAADALNNGATVMGEAVDVLKSWLSSTPGGPVGGPTDADFQALADKLTTATNTATQAQQELADADTADAPPAASSPTEPTDPSDPSEPVTTGDPSLGGVATATGGDTSADVPSADVAATPGPAPTGFDAPAAGQQTNVPGL